MAFSLLVCTITCISTIHAQWVLGTLPERDDEIAAGVYDGTIFIIGGYANGYQRTEYEVSTQTMTNFGSSLGADISGDGQYYTQQDHILYLIVGANTFYTYNMMDRQITPNWRSITFPTDTTNEGCLASTSQHLYLTGGASSTIHNYLQILSLSSYEWIDNPPNMNQIRTKHACVAHNNYLFAFAGTSGSGLASSERVDITDITIIAQQSWNWIDSLTRAMRYLRAVAWQNTVYVVGGYDGNDRVNLIHLVDADTGAVSLSSDPMPLINAWGAPVIYDNIFYVFGGFDDNINSRSEKWAYYPLGTSNPTTMLPSAHPVAVTDDPTISPTKLPSNNPTESPSSDPTESPSFDPTPSPSSDPTQSPSFDPTQSPLFEPTVSPLCSPTQPPLDPNKPTESPLFPPTQSPVLDATTSLMEETQMTQDEIMALSPSNSNKNNEIILALAVTVSVCGVFFCVGCAIKFLFMQKKITELQQNQQMQDEVKVHGLDEQEPQPDYAQPGYVYAQKDNYKNKMNRKRESESNESLYNNYHNEGMVQNVGTIATNTAGAIATNVTKMTPVHETIVKEKDDNFIMSILFELNLIAYYPMFQEFNITQQTLLHLDSTVIECLIEDDMSRNKFVKWLKKYKHVMFVGQQEEDDNEDLYNIGQQTTKESTVTTTGTHTGGETRDLGKKVCAYCGLMKMGKMYDSDGLFYCNKCWQWYASSTSAQ